MNTPARNVSTAVLIALGAVALAAAFLRPSSTIEVQQERAEGFESATAETALITSIAEEGGMRLLGISLRSPTYRVAVAFTAPPGCLSVIQRSGEWPTGDEACGPTGDLFGEVSGSGIAINGDTIVSVQFEVDEECWEEVAVGDVWAEQGSVCLQR